MISGTCCIFTYAYHAVSIMDHMFNRGELNPQIHRDYVKYSTCEEPSAPSPPVTVHAASVSQNPLIKVAEAF